MLKFPNFLIIPAVIILFLTAGFMLANKLIETNYSQYYYGGQNKPAPLFKKENTIDPLIAKELANLPGQYAIYIKDLKRNDTYGENIEKSFSSASIYKLAVMYRTFEALEKGELQKNTVLSQDVAVLDQTLAPEQESQESSSATVSYTVENALRLMITISDNYAALLLAERFGWTNIDKFMEMEGYAGFNLVGTDSPNVTAKSVGDLLEKIYRNKAVSHLASEEMKTLLFAQTVNDRIPKYLPGYAKVGHKTGELGTVRHDAGIVLGKKGDNIFVILSDTPQPTDAIESIAKLSEKIFKELEK